MSTRFNDYIDSIKNKKIAFVGLGVANLPCVEFFAKKGLKVYACDSKDEEYIGLDKCNSLKDLGVEFSLGSDYLSVLPEMDIIFRSNGILPFQHPWIGECIERGQIVTSEMEVFFEYCPCKIIGITGSNGKTTTTTLISKLLEQSGKRVFLGGNIGKALMPVLDDVNEDDIAVVELSSFQLLTMGNMVNKPYISVVTNIESTHLDHHISLDEYVDSKRNILIYQSSGSKTILNADWDYSIGNRVYHDMRYDVRGHLLQFSIKHPVDFGTYMDENGDIFYVENGIKTFIMNKDLIRIPGSFNVENFCAAISATFEFVSVEDIVAVTNTFNGVEHRIELVREFNGVKYYNDSIATAPSRVINGISSFDQKLIVIMGGSDKGNDMSEMNPYINKHVKTLILNGATADKIYNTLVNDENFDADATKIIRCNTLEEAVNIAKDEAKPGDIVTLCPACPAFDQFRTFEYRGRKYKELINEF